jgi:hypothetical protein
VMRGKHSKRPGQAARLDCPTSDATGRPFMIIKPIDGATARWCHNSLFVRDGLFREQIIFEFFVKRRILAANPFQHH